MVLGRWMRMGLRNYVALPWDVRFWMMRRRLLKVRLGMWNHVDWFRAALAKDDVIPVSDVVPPEVGLSHLFGSDGHSRPSRRGFPQFCSADLYFVVKKLVKEIYSQSE